MVDRISDKHEIVRRLFVSLFLLLFAAPAAFAQELPFRPGERLLFSARWLFFDAGMVEAAVPEITPRNGNQYLLFTLHTWTTHTIARIFTMDDHFESMWDPRTRLPKRLNTVIRESNTTRDKLLEFDHAAETVTVTQNGKPPETLSLDRAAQDFFSASYFIRTVRLKPKQELLVPVFEDNRNYHADIHVVKRERIPVLGGQADALMLIARLKFEGAFTGSGLLYVWLTDDDYQVPVRLKMELAFGEVVLDLVKAEGTPLKIIRPKNGNNVAEKE